MSRTKKPAKFKFRKGQTYRAVDWAGCLCRRKWKVVDRTLLGRITVVSNGHCFPLLKVKCRDGVEYLDLPYEENLSSDRILAKV